MELTILGSGTSYGIPVIGCGCRVCSSDDPRDRRTRCSALISTGEVSILIDTATDFRYQALAAGITRLDAILYTHAHADHVHGLDDTRSLTFDAPIPVYGNEATLQEITHRFDYVFDGRSKAGWAPRLIPRILGSGSVGIHGVEVTPVPIMHGRLPILGYRIGNLGYVTDCSEIPPASLELLRGIDTLVLGALRFTPHITHLTIADAVGIARKLSPSRTILTHFSHEVSHREVADYLPEGIVPAYDGMRSTVD